MSISVRIPPVLRTQTGGAKLVSVDGASLSAVLTALTAAHPELREQIFAPPVCVLSTGGILTLILMLLPPSLCRRRMQRSADLVSL